VLINFLELLFESHLGSFQHAQPFGHELPRDLALIQRDNLFIELLPDLQVDRALLDIGLLELPHLFI
jgi:hypothetical protein